jgi:hypothetical protein
MRQNPDPMRFWTGFLRYVAIPLLLVGAPAAMHAEPFQLGPPVDDGPVRVSVGFFLTDVNEIDEQRESFEFEAILTLKWRDPRQAFDSENVGAPFRIYQGDYQFAEVFDGWWPQLMLANESGGYDSQSVLLRIAPDGSVTLVQEINAHAEMPIQLRRFPFDRQDFEARFEVLGLGQDQVVLVPDPTTSGTEEDGVDIAQWKLEGLSVDARTDHARYGDQHDGALSVFVATLDMARRPVHMLQIVVFPLTLLVVLTFSVFWMDRESLGDRMDISFIGILTVVAYQIIVSDATPGIAYFTLMSAFLYSTYVVLAIGVVENIVVSRFDRSGRPAMGDRLDRTCRWLVPLVFVSANLLSAAYFFLRY